MYFLPNPSLALGLKNPDFSEKPNPVGFIGLYWVLLFFFWGVF